MNPRISDHGLSFKGAWQYYMHDPKAETRERIEWAETYGTITNDPDKAWKVMAYTAKAQDRLKEASGQKMTGRKDVKPVMAYSLSWHPDHDPDKDHMQETAIQSIKELGLEEHEAIIVAHRDTPHRHAHVIVNRIHPLTGLVADDSYTKRKLSDFARIYCKENNMEYSPKREENHQKRQQGQNTKYNDQKIEQAWNASDSGTSFAAALEEQGYKLAQGRRRLVVVDPYGKVHNPVRHLEGIKAKEFNDRMTDIDRAILRDADELAKEVQSVHEAKKEAGAKERNNTPEAKKEFSKASEKPAKQTFNEQAKQTPQTVDKQIGQQKTKNETPKQEAAIISNSRQNNRLREETEISQRFQRRIAKEEQTLSSFYRLDEQKERIAAMKKKIETASWWEKLFRITKRDQIDLTNMQRNYANAQSRYDERINAERGEFDQDRAEVLERYKQPSQTVSNNPERRNETKNSHEKERQKRIDYIRERQMQNRTRDKDRRGGPS